MDSHPSTSIPSDPDRRRATSPLRQINTHSRPTPSSAPTRTHSTHNPLPKHSQPPSPNLRRPSGSAPGLTPRPEHSILSSPPLSPRPESTTIHRVLETHHIQSRRNLETGNPTINNYEILGDIGAGVHGKVKKAKDSESGQIVAIKIINRVTKKRLGNYDPNEQENKIKREIAIMKKCHHPNIVNLIEVIDNPNSQKVYLGTLPSMTGLMCSAGICGKRRN
jgi:SNF1-activating kinase 1